MLKPLLLFAVVANLISIVFSSGPSSNSQSRATAFAQSFSSSGSGGSYAQSSSSSAITGQSRRNYPYQPIRCRPNESYDKCPDNCTPRRCEDLGFPLTCDYNPDGSTTCSGKPRCLCNSGYVYNSIGICISQDQCPSCGGDENAQAGCGTNCGRLCSNYDKGPIFCTLECRLNACDCKSEFVFDENIGKCVLPENCSPTCGVNENYSTCTNGGCYGPRNCSQKGGPYICVDLIDQSYCKGGCLCNDGYLRNDDGVCVPEDQCPETCTQQYEIFDPCPVTCPPQTCASIGQIYNCPLQLADSNTTCKGACICEDGYYRNFIGECISSEDCLKCTGPNEYYSCGGECDNVCADLEIQNQTNCPIINIKCNEMCYCESDYARDENNTCIPIEQCSSLSTCGLNEELSTCTQAVCRPQSCSLKDEPVACPAIAEGSCQTGCVCQSGYLRDDYDACIPEDECPSICTEPNEFYDKCPPNCQPETCASIGKEVDCPPQAAVCQPSCRCQKGFYRNDQNICVPEKECSKSCPNGQIWNTCPPQQCDAEYCPLTRDSPQSCISPKNCGEPRCLCGFNQKLDRNTNQCIAISKCPPFQCNGPNEEYQSCPSRCPGENCSDFINKPNCTRFGRIGIVVPCQPECRCKQGFYRNSEAECIDGDQCLLENNATTPPVTYSSTDVQERISAGILTWTVKFLNDVIQNSDGSNYIMSPFSVEIPLAILALYSSGNSYDQLTSVLNIADKGEIRNAFKSLIESYKSVKDVIFNLAAKIYGNDKYPLSEPFLNDTSKVMGAEAENIDCSKPSEAASVMNKWVEDNTNQRIKDLVTPDMINSLTRLVMINALYFKGTWKYTFNVNDTEDRDFYVNNNETKQVPTMYKEENFGYAESEELDARFLEIPYKNENFSLVIGLPNNIEGLKNMISKCTGENLRNVFNSLVNQKVQLWLPKMETKTTLDLKQILSNIGVTDIFEPEKSDLNGILEKYEPLYVSAAKQQSFYKHDEEGSEAAAANVIAVSLAAIGPEENVYFQCDRPFLFFINYNGDPIFCGAYQGQ